MNGQADVRFQAWGKGFKVGAILNHPEETRRLGHAQGLTPSLSTRHLREIGSRPALEGLAPKHFYPIPMPEVRREMAQQREILHDEILLNRQIPRQGRNVRVLNREAAGNPQMLRWGTVGTFGKAQDSTPQVWHSEIHGLRVFPSKLRCHRQEPGCGMNANSSKSARHLQR